uniref:Periaxin n=1 Tax=Oryzias latipes TaxID=8090 RepID=A0A3P9HEB0_ORYLA
TSLPCSPKSVEIVVETDAEVGASGYSVTGGGERGIFVKDVLKDSPAAKHLSLQQGDQLLSAKVYFDNVRYEDALKILQCAEPYKVSFQLKRTVPETEVSVRPRILGGDVKGPKAKVAKMVIPLFILLKEKNKEEVVMEGTPPRLEAGDVDVEFSLPTFRQRKGVNEAEPVVGKGKKRIRLCFLIICRKHWDYLQKYVKTGGVEEKIQMPDTDVSFSEGKVEVDTNVEGPEVKGGKFKMPKFDISFSNKNLPEGKPEVDISTTKGKIKEDVDLGGKLPTVDFSPPKMQAKELHVDIKPPETTNLHISSPKVALPGGDVKIECPNIKGRKIEMPDIDLSLPKGKGKGDIETTGSSHKGGKFHMPAIDITLHKMKTKGTEVHVESPEVKGGQIKIPSLHVSGPKLKLPDIDDSLKGPEVEGKIKKPKGDISLPKGEVQGDFEVEGPDMKGGKFKMPKFDVSLPKVSLPKIDASVEGPDLKGKAEMPSVDISVPKGTTDLGVDVDTGKGSRFHMPSLDLTLPKMKTKGLNVNVERPEVKGDMSLSEIKSPDVDVNIKGPEVVGGYISLPNLDVAFPKTEGDFEVEGPDMKDGKFKMPKFDVSLPKVSLPKFDANVKGPDLKGKAEMPSVEMSVPKATTDVGFDVNVERPEVKGDMSLPEVKSPDVDFNFQGPEVKGGKLSLPKVDIALPKTEGDFEVEGPDMKGGKFKMPKFDVSLPKVSLPKFDATEMPSVDISAPKGTTDLGVDVDTVDVSFPQIKKMEGDIKKAMGLHMPSIDLHLPKVDFDLSLPSGSKGRGLKVDTSGPDASVDLDFEVFISPPDVEGEDPDVSVDKTKYKVKLPKFKISSPTAKLPEKEGDMRVEADGKGGFHAPDVTIKLPKFSMPGFGSKEKDLCKPVGEVETKTKLKMPSVELSLQETKTPDTEVLLPKAEVDVSEADIRGYEGNLKVPKMPKIDVSIPKVDPDVSLPKGKSQKIEKTDVDVKGEGKFKIPQIKMPSVDIDIPKGKSVLPDVEVDVDRGKFNMPYVKMPSFDITLPKPKTGKALNVDAEGDVRLRMPDIKMPNVNISEGTNNKLEGPNVDIQGRGKLKTADVYGNNTPEMEMGVQGEGKVKLPHMKMPDFDVSFPKRRTKDSQMEIKDKGGKLKTPNVSTPPIDISLSTGKDTEVEESSGGKFKMPIWKRPDVDIPLPKGHMEGPEVESTGERGGLKMPHISLPSVDISLPKRRADAPHVERRDGEEKCTTLYMKMPSVDPNKSETAAPHSVHKKMYVFH